MTLSFYRYSLLLLSFVSTADATVLLEKIKTPGFVMPSYAISSRCTLAENGVLTTQVQLEDLVSKHSTFLQLTTLKLKAKINDAALGSITSNSFPVDAATVSYRAYQKQADGSIKQIVLYEQNGNTGVEKNNTAEAAITLRSFIDLNCGDPLLY